MLIPGALQKIPIAYSETGLLNTQLMGCALWELPASVGSRVPAWDTQLWRGVPRYFLHMEKIIRTNSHPSPSDVPGFLYWTEMVWSFISCVTLFNRYLVGQEKNGSVVVCCIACSEFHTLHSTVEILKAVKCRFSRFSVSCLLGSGLEEYSE